MAHGSLDRTPGPCALPALAALAALAAACARAPAPPDAPAIAFRAAAQCGSLEFRAQLSRALPVSPLAEVVIAVNGQICHREGIPGDAIVHGEVAALCADASLFEPGSNLVEVAVVPPGCGARPIAARRILCAGPEPD
jgi:hypothetical protein